MFVKDFFKDLYILWKKNDTLSKFIYSCFWITAIIGSFFYSYEAVYLPFTIFLVLGLINTDRVKKSEKKEKKLKDRIIELEEQLKNKS